MYLADLFSERTYVGNAISNSSVVYAENNTAVVNLGEFCEPRIEPEIVIGLKECPPNDPSIEQVVKCVDWVAPGFEIVDSIYPNWKFSVPDTIAAGGLHGKLIIGRKVEPTENTSMSCLSIREYAYQKMVRSLKKVVVTRYSTGLFQRYSICCAG